MTMTPGICKLALTAHVMFSVGWLGSVAAFLALAVTGVTSENAWTVRACYLGMELVGWLVIIPCSLAALVTGLVQSPGTQWSLFRHYWVLVKFLLTIGATILLLLHMGPVGRVSALASAQTLSPTDLGGLRIQLVSDAGLLALLVLLVNTTLSVYKPWGITVYGRRRLRHTGNTSSNSTESGTDTASPVTRPWGLYVLLGIAGLVLLFVVVHLAGGGLGKH